MAAKDRGNRGKVRASGLRQPLRHSKDTQWDRARRNAQRRSELHSPQPAGPEEGFKEGGFVYIMRDALGAIKVGHTYDMTKRLFDVQYLVALARRPVILVRAVEVPRVAMKRVEYRTFRLLRDCRISPVAEWFDTTASVASRRLNEAIRQISTKYPRMMKW